VDRRRGLSYRDILAGLAGVVVLVLVQWFMLTGRGQYAAGTALLFLVAILIVVSQHSERRRVLGSSRPGAGRRVRRG